MLDVDAELNQLILFKADHNKRRSENLNEVPFTVFSQLIKINSFKM